MNMVIRPIGTERELAQVFDLLGTMFTPRMTRDDRRYGDLVRRFEEDRSLMLVAESDGRTVGGALAFRYASSRGLAACLRIIAVDREHRGKGLGKRLVQNVEEAAMLLGVSAIVLGTAGPDVVGFYQRVGYTGRGTMQQKQLPRYGRAHQARLARLRATAV